MVEVSETDLYNEKINAKITAFYVSFQWRQARYTILKKSAGCCMLCNRNDLPLHVDHIKPLRKYWHLRLNLDNLQVLCEECNHGKGNWDESDWRPQAKKSQPKITQQLTKPQIEVEKKRIEFDRRAERKQRQFAKNRQHLDRIDEQNKVLLKRERVKAKRLRNKIIVTIIKKQRHKIQTTK